MAWFKSVKNEEEVMLDTNHWDNGKKMSEGNLDFDGDGELCKTGKCTYWYENGQKEQEGTYKDGDYDGKWTHWHENGQKEKESTYKDGELISEIIYLKERILHLLKEKAVKMPVSDIDAFLKHQDVDEIKELCEEMYHNGKISRTGNYRYFILTEEKKKPKKASAPKSEEVDVEKELEKLKGLLDKGLITQEMYDAKAKELLGL